jgi:hypothetical protein
LLNVFGKNENKKLSEFLMKENYAKQTSVRLASKNRHEKIVKVLSQKLTIANNKKVM